MSIPESARVFTFDSGGPDVWGPYGRWTVTLDVAGNLMLAHHLLGQTHAYGPTALDLPTRDALWARVDALDLPNLPSSTRPPVPDEGAYTLRLESAAPPAAARIWRADARRAPRLAALVAALTDVIAAATGVRPVLG